MESWRKIVRRWNCKELWILLAALVVILLIAKPPHALVRRYHALKAPSVERAAMEAADSGDWQEAYQQAGDGLYWSPQSYPLQRVLAQAMARQGEAFEGSVLYAVFANPSATRHDRLMYLSIAVSAGDLLTFRKMYAALSEVEQELPEVVVQQVRLNLLLGRPAVALREYERLPAEFPGSDQARIYGNTAKIRSASIPGDFVEAQQAIASIIADVQRKADETLSAADGSELPAIDWQAFRLLDEIPPPQLGWQFLPGVKAWFEERGDAKVADQLIAATIDLMAIPEQERAAFRVRIAERYQEQQPAVVGRWLLSLAKPEEALQLSALAPDLAVKQVDTFEVRLQALVASERWQEAFELLNRPPSGAHPVMTSLAKAKISKQLDDPSMKRKSIGRAIEEAEGFGSAAFFFMIARDARQLGEPELATDAAVGGVRVRGTDMLPPTRWFDPVQAYLWGNDRIDDFRAVNHAMLQQNPNDFVLLNNELFLVLLQDRDPDLSKVVEVSRKLVKAQPKLPGLRSTLAWALLRRQSAAQDAGQPVAERSVDEGEAKRSDTKDALAAMSASEIDWSAGGATDHLILAMAQWADGQFDAARKTLDAIDAGQLTKKETEVLWKPFLEKVDSQTK